MEKTLEEATLWARPKHLCSLFATILLICSPSRPQELFDEFQHFMAEDFLYGLKRLLPHEKEQDRLAKIAQHKLLFALQSLLKNGHQDNYYFNIPMPDITICNLTSILNEQNLNEEANKFFRENYGKLNAGQRHVFDLLVAQLKAKKGGVFSLDAFAGAGKTFLANLLLSFIRTQHETAIATAMSGIAATLLMSGTTFHNRFGIPIPCYEGSSSKLNLRSIDVDIIKKSFFSLLMKYQ